MSERPDIDRLASLAGSIYSALPEAAVQQRRALDELVALARDAAKAWEFEHKMMERATEAEEKLEAAEARVAELAAALRDDPERLARMFHEAYERLAPEHGYETRRESAVPWDDVPENNRALMMAVCAEVGAALAGDGGGGDG